MTKMYTELSNERYTNQLKSDLDNIQTWSEIWQLNSNTENAKLTSMIINKYAMCTNRVRVNIDNLDKENLGTIIDRDIITAYGTSCQKRKPETSH